MCIVCVGLLSGQLSVQLCCLSVQPNFAHFIIFITVLHVCFYGLNKVELSGGSSFFGSSVKYPAMDADHPHGRESSSM